MESVFYLFISDGGCFYGFNDKSFHAKEKKQICLVFLGE